MKRRLSDAELNTKRQAAAKRRKQKQVARAANMLPVRPRTSLVPLGSRGYIPNGIEKKAIDIAGGLVNITTTGSFTLLNGIVQGTDINQRIGRKIILRSIFLRAYVYVEPAVNPTSPLLAAAQVGRIMLVWDRQANATTPAVTDILQTVAVNAQLNLANRDRFVILKEKMFAFDPMIYNTTASSSVASLNRTIVNVKIYKKLWLESIFNAGNGGAVGDIQSGALYLFTVGSIAAGTTDMNIAYTSRIRFEDP